MLRRLGAFIVTLGLMLSPLAFAQTAADTRIENQATATYNDSSGQAQVATSNLAVTIVAQVYGLTVVPDSQAGTGTGVFGATDPTNFIRDPSPANDEQVLPGSSVNFAYTISNTGNGTDNVDLSAILDPANSALPLTNIRIYRDLNGNGKFDSGETDLTALTPSNRISIPAGSSVKLVVSAQTPSSATSGTNFKLDLTATSVGDTTKLDRNNLSRVRAVSDAILDLSNTATLNASGVITYALQGSNIGNQCARAKPAVVTLTGTSAGTYNGILIDNAIPANATYVASSASGATGAALSVVIYQTAASAPNWTLTQPAAASVTRVGVLILPAAPITAAANTTTNTNTATPPTTTENTVCLSTDYRLDFQASVNNGVAAGTVIVDTGTIAGRSSNRTTDIGNTATSSVTVANLRGAVIGPLGFATAATALSGTNPAYTDPATTLVTGPFNLSGTGATTSSTGRPPLANRGDVQSLATARMNTVLSYVNTVCNTGNNSDNFTLRFIATAADQPAGADPTEVSNLPAATNVSLFQSDGQTPLSGPLNLARGACASVVVKVSLPAAAPPATGAPFSARIAAISQSDNTVWDITNNQIAALTSGLGVTILNNDSNTATTPPAGTSSTTVILSTAPGVAVTYPLVVNNTGASIDTFNLTATGAGLPAGSSVQFFADNNGDGIPDNATLITNTGAIPTGGFRQLVAVVTPAGNAAPQTGNAATLPINLTATSTGNAATSASQTDSLTITAINAFSFTPDNSQTASSPGTVVYLHDVKNNGNVSVTALQLLLGAGNSAFKYKVYLDNGTTPGVIDASDQEITAGGTTLTSPIAAGATTNVLVQVSIDSGVPASTIDDRTINLSATFTGGGISSASVKDKTTVVAGNLQLVKLAAVDPLNTDGKVRPRSLVSNAALSNITYTINVSNVGSAPVSSVIVADPIPTFTDLVLGSSITVGGCPIGATCQIQYSTTGGTVWVNYVAGTGAGTTANALDTNTNGYSDAGDATRITNIRLVITNTTSTPVNAFPNGVTTTLTFVVSVR